MTFFVQERLTKADFQAIISLPENDDRLWELIQGEMVEKMPTEEHGTLAALIAAYLVFYVKQRGQGRVGVEVRYENPLDDANSLIPDVSLTFSPEPIVTEGSVSRLPDLAVEIKSPRDTYESMRAKADLYLDLGTKMVWLVFPNKQQIEVHQAGLSPQVFSVQDTLMGGEVLPNFSAKIKDLLTV